MYEYKAKVINVVDGDTFDMDVDLGFNIHVNERFRILNIDTPEKRGKETPLGLKCKDYAVNLLLGKEVVIRSEKSKTDSFGRWLAEVEIDGKLLVDIYNELGINKKNESYNEDNVRKLVYKD